jgi:hypothetical protein
VKEYTLNPDGSTDFRYIKQQKLLTSRAFHNLYGETFVVYHPQYQQLKVNESFTIIADGKKVVTPENAFNEVLPRFAANAPDYNALREMVITHTGLERNATIHLDYEVHTAKNIAFELSGNELLAENEPVNSLEVRIRIPADRELFYHLFNGETQPVQRSDGAFRVFTWKITNIPALSYEESQPGANDRYPRLIFSTSGKREKVFSVLTDQPAFRLELSDPMKRVVNEVVTAQIDPFKIALKLQELVVNDLQYHPIPLKNALYNCRTPGEAWNSNGGTSVEKAVLLAALLKNAGIDAGLVAVARTTQLNDMVPTLADAEDFAVMAKFRERGEWFFSGTSLNPVNLRLSLPDRTFFLLQPGAVKELTKTGNPKFTIKVTGTFIVSSDPKITGEISIYNDGSAYPFAAVSRDKNRMRNSLSGSLAGKDSIDLKVSNLNTDNGFQTYTARSDKPFRKDTNYFYFNLPASSNGIDSWGVKTLTGKRETPYEVTSLADESYSYTLTLPAGFKVFSPEKKVSVSNKAGTFLWEVKTGNGKLTVRRQLKLSDRVFEGAAYADFKTLMDLWNNPWYRQVIFVSGGS